MEPIQMVFVLAIAFVALLVTTMLRDSRRSSAEDKVLKGYFLMGLSGLMAKIAMADGRVTGEEAALANDLFARMDLTDSERAMCIGNFVTARSREVTPRELANRFMAYGNRASCAFLYDLLWRLSMADGRLDAAEDKLLEDLSLYFGLDHADYEACKRGEKLIHDRKTLANDGVPPSLLALA